MFDASAEFVHGKMVGWFDDVCVAPTIDEVRNTLLETIIELVFAIRSDDIVLIGDTHGWTPKTHLSLLDALSIVDINNEFITDLYFEFCEVLRVAPQERYGARIYEEHGYVFLTRV